TGVQTCALPIYYLAALGFDHRRRVDFVLAVNEALGNVLDHTDGPGTLTLRCDGEHVVAEISDTAGLLTDPDAGTSPPPPGAPRGYGLVAHARAVRRRGDRRRRPRLGCTAAHAAPRGPAARGRGGRRGLPHGLTGRPAPGRFPESRESAPSSGYPTDHLPVRPRRKRGTTMSDYAATFGLVDADGDGLISAQEFARLMEVLG